MRQDYICLLTNAHVNGHEVVLVKYDRYRLRTSMKMFDTIKGMCIRNKGIMANVICYDVS